MKQLLTSFIVASAFACLTSSANASLPFEETLSLEAPTLISATENPTDTMLAQCYGGGYSYGYAQPVYRSSYRSTRYYYPQRRSAISIGFGGGGFSRGGFYPGFGGGFGPGFGRYGGFGGPGFGRGFGRSGLFISF